MEAGKGYTLLILTLAGCFSLILALHAGLLVMLTLTDLSQHARALPLKALQSAFQRLVLLDPDLRHLVSLPSPLSPGHRCFPQRIGDRMCIIAR